MEKDHFTDIVMHYVKEGDIFENPQVGTSKIIKVTRDNIIYIRGRSRISLEIDIMFRIYNAYKGRWVSSSDMRILYPSHFDSKESGHSCNCTFLMMCLKKCGLVSGDIQGKGVRGKPYYVSIPS